MTTDNIRYTFTIDFHEPDLSHLPEEERNAKLQEHHEAIWAAYERLETLLEQSDWGNPLVPLGIRSVGYLSH